MPTVTGEGRYDSCVSVLALVEGPYPVHFSIGCVVHPFALIVAQRGPIYFGAYCIVEEHACIINGERGCEDAAESAPSAVPMTIGPYNHFKSFSRIANLHRIGHGNRFEPHCKLEFLSESPEVVSVEDYCVFGPFVCLCGPWRGNDKKVDAAVTIASRRVYLCPTDPKGEEKCGCFASTLPLTDSTHSSCCCFCSPACWVLPRGEPFDEEEAEDALRQRCLFFCRLSAQ
ncbi:hypothetical protein TcBrA4_0095120 [Trypanosoma cruzi]|nr:hypothetical protein TcBrA4_0095120 [Trypanosoma cruzi]